MAKAISEVGADHYLLDCGLGQSGNPIRPDGYEKMVAGVKKSEIRDNDLTKVMDTNAANLLGTT